MILILIYKKSKIHLIYPKLKKKCPKILLILRLRKQESSDISVKSPVSPTKSPILLSYKIKKEIVTLEESSFKKENKLEVNGNFNKMDMSPSKEIRIKKEIESSLKADINDAPQQEWVSIHRNISENKYKGQVGTLNNYGIDFEEENEKKRNIFYFIGLMP